MEAKCAFGTHEKRAFQRLDETMVGLVHYSLDPQILLFKRKITSKLSSTALFTHLKVILLPYFQFFLISGIQTDLKSKSHIY